MKTNKTSMIKLFTHGTSVVICTPLIQDPEELTETLVLACTSFILNLVDASDAYFLSLQSSFSSAVSDAQDNNAEEETLVQLIEAKKRLNRIITVAQIIIGATRAELGISPNEIEDMLYEDLEDHEFDEDIVAWTAKIIEKLMQNKLFKESGLIDKPPPPKL